MFGLEFLDDFVVILLTIICLIFGKDYLFPKSLQSQRVSVAYGSKHWMNAQSAPAPKSPKLWKPHLPVLPCSSVDSVREFTALRALKPEHLASALSKLDIEVLEPHMSALNTLLVQRSKRMQLSDLARLMLVFLEKFQEEDKETKRPIMRNQRETALWLLPALDKITELALLQMEAQECIDVSVLAQFARVCCLFLPWKKLLANDIYKPYRKVLITVLTHTLRAAETRAVNSCTAHTAEDLLTIHSTFTNIKFLSKNNAKKMSESLLILAEGLENGELVRTIIGDISE